MITWFYIGYLDKLAQAQPKTNEEQQEWLHGRKFARDQFYQNLKEQHK